MIYVVQKGDTLSKICERLFGYDMEYHELAAYNFIENPDKIFVGQILSLHKAPNPNSLTPSQKVINVEPSIEQLDRICDLFREGFCTYDMARDIYKAAIQ
ncbi:endolysin [Cronobacter phage S13]|uniref:LysM domain-containing protein n=1 Tax=Cronobacter phage LPCS28 TaxID=2924885 RepID=A0AAE9G8I2_9CAUD|nr:endolysin [Cronobacter phage S13]YP_010665779.1 hypothetical protein PQB73_gp245 [Cronobacter phage LPCS28]AIA64996.1 hypothetical protein S13_199 [Cronobacter phage S13]UNY46968.1 hypothetical protein EHEKIMEA_00085 [Cronobacter phage LPCS28]